MDRERKSFASCSIDATKKKKNIQKERKKRVKERKEEKKEKKKGRKTVRERRYRGEDE